MSLTQTVLGVVEEPERCHGYGGVRRKLPTQGEGRITERLACRVRYRECWTGIGQTSRPHYRRHHERPPHDVPKKALKMILHIYFSGIRDELCQVRGKSRANYVTS